MRSIGGYFGLELRKGQEYHSDCIALNTARNALGLLPKVNSNELYIPFLPVGGGLINSASCYNLRTIPIRGEDTFETKGKAIPADANLWDTINPFIKERGLKSFLINRTTCYHMEEGHNLR